MRVLSFGEVLWDVYPDKKVIGGAPFNFAGSFASLGGNATLVSAVGNDEAASETIQAVQALSVDTDMIAHTQYPTGFCLVTVNEQGVPNYELRRGVAYDYIPVPPNIQEKCFDALYFGTLAQRSEVSADSLRKIIESVHCKEIIFDINIRQFYYDRQILENGLKACSVLKFSREEAFVFTETGIMERERCMDDMSFLQLLCRYLAKFYDIRTIAVTLDKDGAFAFSREEDKFYFSEKPQGAVISTVGAGDSFCAAFLYGLLQNKPLDICLNNAVIVSDYVVGCWESVPVLPAKIINRLQ